MGEGRILVEATVTCVSDDHFLYPCCTQCYSKLLEDVQCARWCCVKCGESYKSDDLEWRYRLRLTIADANEYRQVAAFGRTVQPFFGASANTFHRFLSHFQRTECHVADMVLRQAVNMVFVGQTFLFGFASVTKDRLHMTVSRLSHVTENKGGNSDLIALQMISPDPCQLTPVSQQISHIFKEIVSRSFCQESLRNNEGETSAGTKLVKRKSSCQSRQNYVNSVLELSENSSANSFGSVLFSCENSLNRNATMSLSSDNVGLKFSPSTESEQSQERLCGEMSCHEKNASVSTVEVARRCTDLEQDDFDKTMNDSSLLLADKDSHLQEVDEKCMSYQTQVNSPCANSDLCDQMLFTEHMLPDMDGLYTMNVDTDVGPENVWEDLPYSEDLDVFLSKADCCVTKSGDLTISTTDHDKNGHIFMKEMSVVQEVVKNQLCDSVVTRSNMEPCLGTTSRAAGIPLNKGYSGYDRCGNMEYETQYCSELSFKSKQTDFDEMRHSHKAPDINEMPESENLEDFLLMAVSVGDTPDTRLSSESETDQTRKDKTLLIKSGQSLSKPCDIIETSHINCDEEAWEDMSNSEILKLDVIKDVESCSEKYTGSKTESTVGWSKSLKSSKYVTGSNRQLQDSPITDVANVTSRQCGTSKLDVDGTLRNPSKSGDGTDLEIFVDSFLEENSVYCHQTASSYSIYNDRVNMDSHSSSDFRNTDRNSTDSSNFPEVDMNSGKENSTVVENLYIGKEIMSARCESPVLPPDDKNDMYPLEWEQQLSSEGGDGAPNRSECGSLNDSQKEKSVPGHLFHSVGSVGSLNASMDLFDASGDLFDEGLWERAKIDSTPPIQHPSCVCDSLAESVKVNQQSKCAGAETTESSRKTVKFAKRLSHISSVQLIDIRLKLNFGMPVDSQLTPVKSCLRRNRLESVRKSDCKESLIKEETNQNSQKHISNHSSGKVDVDYAVSQDLFACSQTQDHITSPFVSEFISADHYSENDSSRLDWEAFNCDTCKDPGMPAVTCHRVIHSPIGPACSKGNNHVVKSHDQLCCNLFSAEKHINSDKRTGKRLQGDTDTHPSTDATPDIILTPCDGSQVLFTQAEYPASGVHISSTPTGDSDLGDMVLTLTPELFTP